MSHLHLVPGADGGREPSAVTRPVDMTGMVVRLADRYRSEGHGHPIAAATAVTARGLTGLDRPAFAERFGLTEAQVVDCESGRVAFDDLPAEVDALIERSGRVDLLHLTDLEQGDRRRKVLDAVAAARSAWGSSRVPRDRESHGPDNLVEVSSDRWHANAGISPWSPGEEPEPIVLAMACRSVRSPIRESPRRSRIDVRMREVVRWTISDFMATDPLDRP
jgi:hypothetical protein